MKVSSLKIQPVTPTIVAEFQTETQFTPGGNSAKAPRTAIRGISEMYGKLNF
jgi:hypothetical protein